MLPEMEIQQSNQSLIAVLSFPWQLSHSKWELFADSIEKRLNLPILIVDGPAPSKELASRVDQFIEGKLSESSVHRCYVITLGKYQPRLDFHDQLRCLHHPNLKLFLGREWNSEDWAQLLCQAGRDWVRSLPLTELSTEADDPIWRFVVPALRDSTGLRAQSLDSLLEIAEITAYLRNCGVGADYDLVEQSELETWIGDLPATPSPVVVCKWQNTEVERNRFVIVREAHDHVWSTLAIDQLIPASLFHIAVLNQFLLARRRPWVPIPPPVNEDLENTRDCKSGGDSNIQFQWRFDFMTLMEEIDQMLPEQYQGNIESVRTQSMGSAKLVTDSNGQIAWDKIWTSFCDLAIAGGPPHRGTLLESVTAEEVSRDLENYRSVVDEIARGIRLASQLETVESPTLGWIGIKCQSDEMAVWLQRAILAENIIVRREGRVLFLPAAPHFRKEKEVKNVITSVAKTVHYWHHKH